MQPSNTISTAWNDDAAVDLHPTGVSLHSHTSMSEETLTFIHKMFAYLPGLKQLFAFYEHRGRANGIKLDFQRGHWRPPLVPRMAYDLESSQIHSLGLRALVSLTDHDNIEAPMLLRTVTSARGIPVSTEWSVPFQGTEFHLGVHNLPSADGAAWMQRFNDHRANPDEVKLRTLLNDLDAEPGVLLILNHPLWDLYQIGQHAHEAALANLLTLGGKCFHALELNGLRDVRENLGVIKIARETGLLLISGGDRHSLEPNAVINLSHARSFREFVDEVRIERRSHVLFMRQYSKPWHQRILHSTLDAVTDFPDFPLGWRRWDERAFHPDRDGVMRPIAELWPNGRAPLPLRAAVEFVRLGRSRTFTGAFNMAMRANDPIAEMDFV